MKQIFIEIFIVLIIIYGVTLPTKWKYESDVIVKELLTDILAYDKQIMAE